MGINLSNFIFHSDYLPLPLQNIKQATVNVSGTVAAFNKSTFTSSWVDVGTGDALLLDFVWYIPTQPSGWTIGGVDSVISTAGSRVKDDQIRLVGPSWSTIANGVYIERNGTQARAVITITNQTVSTQSLPTFSVNFDIYTFLNKNA